MQNLFKVLFFLWLILIPFISHAQTLQIEQGIEQLLAHFHESINVGIVIQSLSTGEILYSKNASRLFAPASTLKLLTGFAALSHLGKDFRFQTLLLAEKPHMPDLYIKFSGDPQLSATQLENLLQNAHISKIAGNLYLDDSIYDTISYGPGWMWDDANYCFATGVIGLNLDHNCFSVQLKPGIKTGMQANTALLSPFNLFTISNRIITTANIAQLCPIEIQGNTSNHYQLRGCIPLQAQPQQLDIAIRNPHLYAKQVIMHLLNKQHIALHGNIAFKKAPETNIILASVQSKPLAQMLADMLKESDNLIADSLFKQLGANYFKSTGNWKNGSKAVLAILEHKNHIRLDKAALYDGAGGSGYDLLKPEHIAKVLFTAYHTPQIAETFIPALAIGGIDGTLKHRMQDPLLKGKVYAKTGSMHSASALAGFVATANNQPLLFVILINGFSDPIQRYQQLQDQIVHYLASVNL